MPLTFEQLTRNVQEWAARCARVSYLKHDGTAPSIGEDLALFERLAGGTPIHASPLEHQGLAGEHPRRRSRNFVGWWQFRVANLVRSCEWQRILSAE